MAGDRFEATGADGGCRRLRGQPRDSPSTTLGAMRAVSRLAVVSHSRRFVTSDRRGARCSGTIGAPWRRAGDDDRPSSGLSLARTGASAISSCGVPLLSQRGQVVRPMRRCRRAIQRLGRRAADDRTTTLAGACGRRESPGVSSRWSASRVDRDLPFSEVTAGDVASAGAVLGGGVLAVCNESVHGVLC
jgi:hypothetical protein